MRKSEDCAGRFQKWSARSIQLREICLMGGWREEVEVEVRKQAGVAADISDWLSRPTLMPAHYSPALIIYYSQPSITTTRMGIYVEQSILGCDSRYRGRVL